MAKTCSYDGCTNPVWSKGYCKWHQWVRKLNTSNDSARDSGEVGIGTETFSTKRLGGSQKDGGETGEIQEMGTDQKNSTEDAGLGKPTNNRSFKSNKTKTKDRGLFNRKSQEVSGSFEADKSFYNSIWESREHVCFNCGKYLGGEALTLYFHHILEKRNFPEFRHVEWNIVLLCADCHLGYETYPNPKRFQKIINYREKLLITYGEENQQNDV